MESALGRKLVLWKTSYKSDAYKDQLGITHGADVVTEEIPVEIYLERDVLGDYGGDHNYKGCKAKSIDGREFQQNWHTFSETSSTPTYYWFSRNDSGEIEEFVDAVQAANNRGFGGPYVTESGQKAKPNNVEACEKHNYYWYANEEFGCWYCHLEGRNVN